MGDILHIGGNEVLYKTSDSDMVYILRERGGVVELVSDKEREKEKGVKRRGKRRV